MALLVRPDIAGGQFCAQDPSSRRSDRGSARARRALPRGPARSLRLRHSRTFGSSSSGGVPKNSEYAWSSSVHPCVRNAATRR